MPSAMIEQRGKCDRRTMRAGGNRNEDRRKTNDAAWLLLYRLAAEGIASSSQSVDAPMTPDIDSPPGGASSTSTNHY